MTTRKLRTKTKGELEEEKKAGRKKGSINGGKGLASHAQLLVDCLNEGDITKDLKVIYRDWQRHASKINNRRTGPLGHYLAAVHSPNTSSFFFLRQVLRRVCFR
jgi:hypothetical protein